MEITKYQLEVLASQICQNLQCACGLHYEESHKEPCACGWTPIADWFEDEFNMNLKVYEDSIKKFYKDEYDMDIIFKEKK